MRSFINLVMVSALLLACQQIYDPLSTAPGGEYLKITTERNLYHISQRETIHVTAVNIATFSLYRWSPSFFARLQRENGSEWETIGPWYDIAAIVPRPHRIAPGNHISVLPLICSDTMFKNPGTYRIVLDIYSDAGLQHLLSMERRVSKDFCVIK
ncbi:MAG: hypothetical protein EH225_04260 [Calditrichaeota bacterium]|nr:hypothetical protein [Calditrichota bacterium]RQW05798.1 MAG: hypothetical protein EH225_04260 [Calditrichota bacterium]